MSAACISCRTSTVNTVIDLGPQPPSNRFLASPGERCETHALRFGYCTACGLAQLVDPMAVDIVRSRHGWITYKEPEGHLDRLVASLCDVTGVAPGARIAGLTYKDDSTLARFSQRGVTNTYRLDQVRDLDIADPLASLETVQARLTPERATAIADRTSRADIVVARHILEHAHQPMRLIEACQRLAKPDGWLVFEVPDCGKVFDGNDHCFLWEEHIAYFTPDTLMAFLGLAGFADISISMFPYPMENSLVAIVRNHRAPQELPHDIDSEVGRVERFGGSLAERGARVRNYLRAQRAKGNRLAVFGAGHLSTKFINFYQLAPLLAGVVDDNPNKQSLFMPGSGLPIFDSSRLDQGQVDLCLLTLNPESEQKVLNAKAAYVGRGGRFRSIFSASANSIDLDFDDDRLEADQ
jgi:SAM-dependent methyltransferase